ncbi:MAG: hypothetical protein ACRD0F_03215, partial [Acidimicrobiales bacterium]
VAVADIAGTLVQLGALYASGRPLVRALEPSPGAMAVLGAATLLVAVAGPAILARCPARRARALEPAMPSAAASG